MTAERRFFFIRRTVVDVVIHRSKLNTSKPTTELKKMTFTARLNRKINAAARIRFISIEMQAAYNLAEIKAKAAAFIANNPAPRAMYLLG